MKKKKIYIIDDEETIIEEISEILEYNGYDVRNYSDPIIFLKTLEERIENGIFVVDLRMPGVNGFEIIKKIRDKNNRKTYIISISGHATEYDIEKSLEKGADYFIRKPFEIDELLEILERCSQDSRAVD